MSHKDYPRRLTDHQILELFELGIYEVDLDEGVIYSGRSGKELKAQHNGGNGWRHEHPIIRLYFEKQMRKIGLSKVIWMAGSKSIIPAKFEIHHYNGDTKDCRWCNLFCLHKLDHEKAHHGITKTDQENVPF